MMFMYFMAPLRIAHGWRFRDRLSGAGSARFQPPASASGTSVELTSSTSPPGIGWPVGLLAALVRRHLRVLDHLRDELARAALSARSSASRSNSA
jgi:hypothetical protein